MAGWVGAVNDSSSRRDFQSLKELGIPDEDDVAAVNVGCDQGMDQN